MFIVRIFCIKRPLFVRIVWGIISIKMRSVRNVRGLDLLAGPLMILGVVVLVMVLVPSRSMVVRIVKGKAPLRYMLRKLSGYLKMPSIINKSYSKVEDINI